MFFCAFFPISFKTRDLPQNVLKFPKPHPKKNGSQLYGKNISTVVIFFPPLILIFPLYDLTIIFVKKNCSAFDFPGTCPRK